MYKRLRMPDEEHMTASQIMEATVGQSFKKPMRKKPAETVASGSLGGKKAAKK